MSFNAEIEPGYETPDELVSRGTPKRPPGAPLRPTRDPMVMVEWNLFDPYGSPTKVFPLKSKDQSGAPMRLRGASVAVCPQRNPSMFHLSEVHPSDFGSYASPLRTRELDDKTQVCPPRPVKERPSRF
jgi:hypothetical protein